jgi:hypothetical protein
MEGEEVQPARHTFKDHTVVIYEHKVTDDIVPHWANIWYSRHYAANLHFT